MLRNELSCDCNIIHKDVVARALKNKPEDYELIALSEVFKILGDLTRIKIIWTLDKEEMCVCDIANVLNMSKSSISHQLAILRKASIVKYRKSGKEVYYSLDDDHICKLYEIGIEHIEHKKRKEEKNEKI
jgi:ArsR family transcriptional regulator